jgi:hypothetical protein
LLTAEAVPVAETVVNPAGLARRRYPYPGLASVTGYYSIRYGVGGTEATFDPLLRGTWGRSGLDLWLDELLHRPLVGQDVTLTIHLPGQVAADLALAEREGAVVVLDLQTGAILVMSSHPTFDPNVLDEQWESLREDESAPLLNRASQGLFPVGDLARLIGLIGLVEAESTLPPDPAAAPLVEMLAPLGESGYLATAHQLGLARTLPGLPAQPGLLPEFAANGTVRDLAVTPLHMARVVGALELEGRLITPRLALTGQPPPLQPAIRATTSRRVRPLLGQIDRQLIGLGGVATPLETGKSWLSWFVGLVPATASSEPIVEPLPAGELILDPAQITSPGPGPTPDITPTADPARFAVVVVVVIESEADRDLALRIAKRPLPALLSR